MTKRALPLQFTVSVDPVRPLVRVTRTSVPYSSYDEVVPTQEAVGRVLDDVGRAGRVLLLDLREAPPNNDPDFERAIRRGSADVIGGFSRVAVLVRTAVGALQVTRLTRAGASDAQVFQEEGAAISFLLSAR